jgi:hypothetical protein
VSEEVCAFVRFELLQGIGGGSLNCIEGSRGGLPHMRLELGEGVFDRIEVGTVGRQIEKFGAAGFNSLPDAGDKKLLICPWAIVCRAPLLDVCF